MLISDSTVSAPNEVCLKLSNWLDQQTKGRAAPARDPGNRVPFLWPPHPVSADYHVLESDWTGATELGIGKETFDVAVARTPYGIFGRIDSLWCEAKGSSDEEMLRSLANACRPLIIRQTTIAKTIGIEGRYTRSIGELRALDHLKLLFCKDRDVANESRTVIETRASEGSYGPSLIRILREDRHADRRVAQWCVLDLFEDLPGFLPSREDSDAAVDAIKMLMWTAEDDYARTIYKAGVVLGGHVCTDAAADALIACTFAPSRVGRRSAIHALFHLCEWMPRRSREVVATLGKAAERDPVPSLRKFAKAMAADIAGGASDHVMEPLFEAE